MSSIIFTSNRDISNKTKAGLVFFSSPVVTPVDFLLNASFFFTVCKFKFGVKGQNPQLSLQASLKAVIFK